MQPLHIQTPVIQSQYLKNKLGKEISFKLELLQPPGSFKLRGIGKLCQQEWKRGVQSFVASSGGNGGVAVAYSGMKLGVPTTVFIPSSSHPLYIDAIKSYGAKDKRMLVELSSGASLSLVYDNHPAIHDYQSILVIVCGGINISHFQL